MTSLIFPPSVSLNANPRSGLMPLHPWAWRDCIAAYAPCLGFQGNTLRDWSGHGNHGTLTNMDAATDYVAANVNGQSCYALDFDGVNDRVQIGDVFNFGSDQSFSARAIIRYSSVSTNYPAIFCKNHHSNTVKGFQLWIRPSDQKSVFMIGDGANTAYAQTVNGITDGKFHVLDCECDRNNQVVRLYLDGVLQQESSCSHVGNTTNAYSLRLGYRQDLTSASNYFPGQIASVSFHTSPKIHYPYTIGPLGPYQGELPQASPRYGIGFQQVDYSYNKLFGLGSHSVDSRIKSQILSQDDAANTTVTDRLSALTATLAGGNNTEDVTTTGPNSYLTKAFGFGSPNYVDLGTASRTLLSGSSEITILMRLKHTGTSRMVPFGLYDGFASGSPGAAIDINRAGSIPVTDGLYSFHRRDAAADSLSGYAIHSGLNNGSWHNISVHGDLSGDSLSFRVDKTDKTETYAAQNYGANQVSFNRNLFLGCLNNQGTADVFYSGDLCDLVLVAGELNSTEKDEWEDGPEPVFTVDPTFSITSGLDYSITLGTAEIDQTAFPGGSNGTVSYEWKIIDNNTGDMVLSGVATSGPITGTLPDIGSYYLTVQPFNDGGMDVDEKFTSSVVSAKTGPYAYATETAPNSSLTDFTWLVDLSELPQAWWDEVDTSDGTKGRCFLADGTQIAADWIDFDDVAETGFLRVLRNVASGSAQTIHIYPPKEENNSYLASSTYGQYNAYDSSWDIYLPLDGDPDDRTSNAYTGTVTGATSGAIGQVGEGYDFDGSGDNIEMTGPTDNPSNKTFMIWNRRDSYGGGNLGRLFNKGTVSTTETIYCGNGRYEYVRVRDTTSGVWAIDEPTASQLNHFAMTYNEATTSSNPKMYLDGVSKTVTERQTPVGSLSSNSDPYKIGNRADDARSWDGVLDEFQRHSTIRSADWIAHEYDQSNDNATFWGTWSFNSGEEENNNGAVLQYYRHLTNQVLR